MSPRLSLIAFACLAATSAAGQPLGTAFTYQGRLVDGGTPASGAFDLQLILFDGAAGGSQVGPIVTLDDVAVTEGLFVVSLDFGAVFSGSRRWLQIGVRPGPTTGAYAVLSPRQELTAAPAALFSTTTPWGGVLAKPAGFADDVDNDTTYTAGTGLSLTGTTIGIPPDGVTASEIAANAVGASEIAADAVGTTEIANGAVAVVDLNVADVDARYLNATEVLTGVNFGDCGTYSVMSCNGFLAGQPGPACNVVPVGGICRVTGAAVCAGTGAGVCGDGSTWYLKVSP